MMKKLTKAAGENTPKKQKKELPKLKPGKENKKVCCP
jgi:hypothetical protein